MATYKATFKAYNATTGVYETFYFDTLAELVALADSRTVQVAIDSLETDVGNLTNALAAVPDMKVVADIPARNSLTGLLVNQLVFVTDATGDATVISGWAIYKWDGAAFLKIAEGESLDVQLEWGAILNGPSSTPSQIDTAVTQAAHSNRTSLDKIGEPAGVPSFDGKKFVLGDLYTVAASEPSVKTPFWFRTV